MNVKELVPQILVIKLNEQMKVEMASMTISEVSYLVDIPIAALLLLK